MKNLIPAGLVLTLVLLVSCTAPSQTGGTLPVAPNPDPGTNPVPVTVPTLSVDSRLPAWVEVATPIRLVTARDYSGLEAIFGIVYPPLVGDPLLRVDITATRERTAEGHLYLGFEDKQEFVYLEMDSAPQVSYRDAHYLDMVFSDDQGAFRVFGPINTSNILTATVSYRIRQSGENQCRQYIVCDWVSPCRPQMDTVACKNYLSETATQVHSLGTVETPYLQWLVQAPVSGH